MTLSLYYEIDSSILRFSSLVANSATKLLQKHVFRPLIEKLGQPKQRTPPLREHAACHVESHARHDLQHRKVRRAGFGLEAAHPGACQLLEHERKDALRKAPSMVFREHADRAQVVRAPVR